jgi:hypothetical protein
MIEKISVFDPNNLIPWSLDIELFEKKYPSIYEIYKSNLSKMEHWEIEEILPIGESLDDVTAIMTSVLLYFPDQSTVSIHNTDFIEWNGLSCDAYSIYSDAHFVYFIISRVQGQAGSLGIWSIKNREWIFTHSDEGFCVEAVIYSESKDIFIGYSEWYHPTTPHSGECFFVVKSNGEYTEIGLNETQESNFIETSTSICKKFMSYEDHYLCYKESESRILIKRGDKRSLYKIL